MVQSNMSSLYRTSYLQQGKLQVTEDDSRLHSLTMPIATHEDFNPAQHPTEDISRTNERFLPYHLIIMNPCVCKLRVCV